MNLTNKQLALNKKSQHKVSAHRTRPVKYIGYACMSLWQLILVVNVVKSEIQQMVICWAHPWQMLLVRLCERPILDLVGSPNKRSSMGRALLFASFSSHLAGKFIYSDIVAAAVFLGWYQNPDFSGFQCGQKLRVLQISFRLLVPGWYPTPWPECFLGSWPLQCEGSHT